MVLMVHGFTGSPMEFRQLAYFLNGHGYTVKAVRLPGHGTSVQDMAKTRWYDWWAHIVESYDEISRFGVKKIVAIGHSMGGLLTLKLAIEKKVDCAVCLSTPIYVQKRRGVLEGLRQWMNRSTPPSMLSVTAEAFYYEKPPLSCLISLWFLLHNVKRSLPAVKIPLLISQGSQDEVVQPRSADYIYAGTSSLLKIIKYYPNSRHSILLDDDRDQVYSDIYHFLNRTLGC